MGFENFKKKAVKIKKELENGSANSTTEKSKHNHTIAEKLAMTQGDRVSAGVSEDGSWGDLYTQMKEKGERPPSNEKIEAAAKTIEDKIRENF